MRDENEMTSIREAAQPASGLAGAVIIPFPTRSTGRPAAAASSQASPDATRVLGDLITVTTDAHGQPHLATLLAATGAIAGFAAQQSLLVAGGGAWAQPKRAEHLDRLLLSESRLDNSLWYSLCATARELGAQHLPEPQKLLASTLRCVGTTQFGVITLPLEYRLNEQPQTALVRLWARVRNQLDRLQIPPTAWPLLSAAAAARRVALDQRQVPPHVALRIVMQAALAMALIEPRLIPGAALKPE